MILWGIISNVNYGAKQRAKELQYQRMAREKPEEYQLLLQVDRAVRQMEWEAQRRTPELSPREKEAIAAERRRAAASQRQPIKRAAHTSRSIFDIPSHPGDDYIDASGAWRKPGEDYKDAGGNWRKPGDDYLDAGGNWRKPGDDYLDAGGNWRKPGDDYLDADGNWRKAWRK